MKTKLQKYFPDLIRSREAVEHEIAQRTGLTLIYNSWTKERQQEFLDFCTGVKGINVMYDFVSKSILNPDAAPERLNDPHLWRAIQEIKYTRLSWMKCIV